MQALCGSTKVERFRENSKVFELAKFHAMYSEDSDFLQTS